MSEHRYWDSIVKARLSRRRVLGGAATIGAGAAALGLVGCGGGSDNKSSGSSSSGSSSSGQPKSGGSLSIHISSPPPSLDPYTQTSFINSYMNGLAYSKLYRFKAGRPEVQPADPTMEPDLAQALPETPDQTTWVFKLKQGLKFHNGRALTSEDVRYAIDRYQNFDKSVHRATYNFVDKIETPDANTFKLTTKAPYADTVQILGGNLGAYISPKEHAEGPDAATKMVGSGPFIHKDYTTGVSLTFAKNPDFYEKGLPYLDEIKVFITTDTAKRVADFTAKSIDASWLFLPDDRDQLKKQRPDAKFEETQGIGGYIYLRTDKPPFNDKRVRQALSMGINRKAIRDAITKGEGESDQVVFVGFPFARKVKDLGAAAKYWDYNPTEAKALLKAAGQETINTTWDHADASVYTQAYVDTSTLTIAQLKDIGINIKDQQAAYSQYISTTYQGQYEGMGHSPRAIPYYLDYLSERFSFADGKRARINLSYVNDPQLEALLTKQRGQFNQNDRLQTVKEIESMAAENQWEIYWSTDTRTFFWDPSVQNYRPHAWFPYSHFQWVWKS
jgi:peptide/nickel transport system substrate-binding protein